MKKAFLLLVMALTSCSGDLYQPDKYLSPERQEEIIRKTIRYSFKLAPQANHTNKFNAEFDWFYNEAIKDYKITAYFPFNDTANYILFERNAKSVWPAKEGIGGVVIFDDQGNVSAYEEVFRTWKMPEDSLRVKGHELFERMVKGEDLTPFRARYKGDRYIEFPDDRFYFDKTDRQWKDRVMDSLLVRPN